MSIKMLKTALILALVLAVLVNTEAKRKRKSASDKAMILRQKETNAVDFIRLAVMRLIYGIATRIGLGEQISEALNGAFVPPGVDDDYSDYNGFGGLLDREDDDDYDY
ncbi:PREDICTED: uncharacterized protein LOC108564659 [Nicrophorus vespilloides]|uniref:Uncharacterized protein LOC108564659 n=1 Tax=Nicrophorus vespilloides TaxID=110193 RepID=A0ABM1MXD1_NICVS|nr:PREDICTED: uncharacterized protein LOC108564659 [Nicrophorus vespilloides]